ncbi:hypothetical protein [Spiroplasma turonicum]|uniref:Transmembrane protein n=1 Tax=Spiroplasma turonicum TaxID=216946 RepID=A0A0K1P7V3_9MOLU|nr:hypothetical protein [Spiroplasma turonicum]AKU80279.1 hypothetical protein STURON_001033 [Spiroplasma turonicum]ALX71280.1 hypothetical protein STURO_v1c10290 [Spiroplasma turonicum]
MSKYSNRNRNRSTIGEFVLIYFVFLFLFIITNKNIDNREIKKSKIIWFLLIGLFELLFSIAMLVVYLLIKKGSIVIETKTLTEVVTTLYVFAIVFVISLYLKSVILSISCLRVFKSFSSSRCVGQYFIVILMFLTPIINYLFCWIYFIVTIHFALNNGYSLS